MQSKTIGELLKEERERQGLSKYTVSLSIPTTQTHVKKIEDGLHSPSLDYMKRICKALSISIVITPDKVEIKTK